MDFLRKKTVVATLVSVGLASFGCGDGESETDPGAEVDPKVAAAEIGPEGGEIVGTDENGFPGVKLVIPAGALEETVEVSLKGSFDETPLPRLADQVGPHVEILPKGTKLAKPATLTVPTDGGLRSAFEDTAADCKVWVRDGEGWDRVEPVATEEGSVTIEIEAFTTAAAGVVLVPKPPICAVCTAPLLLPDPPCVSSVGYCVTGVRDPSPKLQSGTMNVVGDKVHWVKGSGDTYTALSFPIYGNGSAIASNPYTSTVAFGLNGRKVAATAGGSVWFPTTVGSIKFRSDALPAVFDAGIVVDGVVVTGTTEMDVTRVIRDSPGHWAATSFQSSAPMFTLRSLPSMSMNAFGGGGRFFIAPQSGGTCLGSAVASQSNCTSLDTNISSGRDLGATAVSTSEAAFATASYEETKRVTVVGTNGRGPAKRLYSMPNGVAKMAYGDDGKIYAINTSRAEVMILGTDGGISTLTLTDAPVDSDEYLSMIPRDIFRISGKDELLLVVRGNDAGKQQLFRIRKPD